MNLHGQANTTRNATKARRYFQMAAEQGDGDGMANLAAMLTNGDGGAATESEIPRSEAQKLDAKVDAKATAFRWAELAALSGHTKATILLADFLRDGVGVVPDAESAAWMYRKVAERAPTLGLCLRQALEWQMLSTGPATETETETEGQEGEWERAVLLYRMGCEVGFEVACSNAIYMIEQDVLGGSGWPKAFSHALRARAREPDRKGDGGLTQAWAMMTRVEVGHGQRLLRRWLGVLASLYQHASDSENTEAMLQVIISLPPSLPHSSPAPFSLSVSLSLSDTRLGYAAVGQLAVLRLRHLHTKRDRDRDSDRMRSTTRMCGTATATVRASQRRRESQRDRDTEWQEKRERRQDNRCAEVVQRCKGPREQPGVQLPSPLPRALCLSDRLGLFSGCLGGRDGVDAFRHARGTTHAAVSLCLSERDTRRGRDTRRRRERQ